MQLPVSDLVVQVVEEEVLVVLALLVVVLVVLHLQVELDYNIQTLLVR
jgi:hypothetical protein